MDSTRYWSTNIYADNKLDIVQKMENLAKYSNFGHINGALYQYYQNKFKKCLNLNNHYMKSLYESSLVTNGNKWKLKQMWKYMKTNEWEIHLSTIVELSVNKPLGLRKFS